MTIRAKIIKDSISVEGIRLATFEIEVPRIVWSEFMTHRQFSRNAASSRAIPFDKMLEQLTGIPSRFGAANKGMQDDGNEHHSTVYAGEYPNGDEYYESPREAWELAKESAVQWSTAFKETGYHKQIYNRLTEPFQTIKAVVTATEFDNFFWLRDDEMADPTIAELARKMRVAYNESTPELLLAGQWHLPYVKRLSNGEDIIYCDADFIDTMNGWIPTQVFTTEQAIKVSAARCAAVSYRNEDYTLEKCLQLYDRLVGSERIHASALEHQATPMSTTHTDIKPCTGDEKSVLINVSALPATWEQGISHMDRNGQLWSGNFKGWIQYRKTIPNECYNGDAK